MLSVNTHVLLKEDKITLLKKQGVCTALDFLRSEIKLLERLSGLTYLEVIEVKKFLAKHMSAIPINGLTYYKKILSHSVLLSTGISELDNLINGGLITGTIYEICGSADSHKLDLVISILANILCAGHGVYVLDTKNDFSAKRLKAKLYDATANEEETFNLLTKVLIKGISTKYELISALFDIKKGLEQGLEIRVIVIHSLSVLILSSNNTVDNNNILNHLANILRYLAIEFNIIIIVTNLITIWDKGGFEGCEKTIEKVSGGKYWSGIPNVRLKIMNVAGKFEFSLIKNNNINNKQQCTVINSFT